MGDKSRGGKAGHRGAGSRDHTARDDRGRAHRKETITSDGKDQGLLDPNDKKNIKAQWEKHEKEKRQNILMLQQGNVRYSVHSESKTHIVENNYAD